MGVEGQASAALRLGLCVFSHCNYHCRSLHCEDFYLFICVFFFFKSSTCGHELCEKDARASVPQRNLGNGRMTFPLVPPLNAEYPEFHFNFILGGDVLEAILSTVNPHL